MVATYTSPDSTQSHNEMSACAGEVDQIDSPYNSQGVPLSQLRKMQLSDDDRALMNKVKSQGEHQSLHSWLTAITFKLIHQYICFAFYNAIP